jgi:synaptotagmin-like protein
MDATGKEVMLWQQMLDRPNFWVEGAVNIRPVERMNSTPSPI